MAIEKGVAGSGAGARPQLTFAIAGLALGLLSACSDEASPPSVGMPSGGSPAAGAATGGVTGGTQSTAGASTSGGASAGGSGAPGNAGAGGLSAGSGGSAGASAGGSGGMLGIADSIDGFRLESPCIDADHFGSDKQDNCDVLAAVDRQTIQKSSAGDSATLYDVKLHVRGLTEPNTYANGTLTPPRFYVGGETTTTGYTAYSLTVSDPAEVYFFNYNATTGHIVFALDYQVVIPMRGGATVTFDINGQKSVPDGHGVSNRDEVVIPGVPPAPDPFNGQFVHFDVVSVTPQN